jgi:Ca2+-binding EF-hand superfamily protein
MKKLILSLALISVLPFSSAMSKEKEVQQSMSKEKEVQQSMSDLPPEQAAQELMKSNDFNKDGKLSTKEVNTSFRIRRFKSVDKNKDSFLDLEELTESYKRSSQVKAKAN